MKKLFTIVMVFALLIGLIVMVINYDTLLGKNQFYDEGFYVGVTYGGNSVQEAKELINKVKSYTNLFILQSGTLQNATDVEEIGDYAIASKLNFAVYNSDNVRYGFGIDGGINAWANSAKERWGEHFIGIYYYDEPGGDMLDKYVLLENSLEYGSSIFKSNLGEIVSNGVTYWPDGRINGNTRAVFDYQPDGTLTVSVNGDPDNIYTAENITDYTLQIQSYEQMLKQNPIQNYDDAAEKFVNHNKERLRTINKPQLTEESVLVFTADYGLYWWDYQGGYDMMLAELGWNNSITQEIGLVRGAANLQNKRWGTIITWTYTHAPYLINGEEMFNQMKTSYEAGSEYVIIFNYSENRTAPNTLQEEHFQALERFWNDVVQNPQITHGGIKAEAALVLPQNYGWGMRNPNDKIWGIWPADNTTQQIGNQLQNKIDQYGLKLDIVFEDPDFPVVGKYLNIHYWDQK